jgi:hypothetical protein
VSFVEVPARTRAAVPISIVNETSSPIFYSPNRSRLTLTIHVVEGSTERERIVDVDVPAWAMLITVTDDEIKMSATWKEIVPR